jgi:hypothetical protein
MITKFGKVIIDESHITVDGFSCEGLTAVELQSEAIKWALTRLGVNQWIKCSEGMPEINLRVFIHTEDGSQDIGWRFDENDWEIWDASYPNSYVTHWMPLPESPKD